MTSSFVPRAGGVEEHVANVAVQLRQLGHDVVIWSVDQGDDVPSEFRGIPLRYLPCPLPARAPGPALRFAAAALRAWAAWRSALRRDQPELLHVHCFGPNGLYAARLARTAGLPLVLSHHGETFGDANGVFDQSALLRSGLRRSLRQAAAVTSCSRFAADDLLRFGLAPGAAEVVFNGVDLNEAADGKVPGLPGRYVLGVGRLVGTKGFDRLIRAFARACAEDAADGTDLVIGGEGPERSALEELATECGIAHRVHLVGRLSRPQVGAAMAAAQMLVVPSVVEPFGITVLEGWRAGVPVLATGHGGPPEFLEHGVTGLLIDPADPAGMSARIVELLADERRMRSLGHAGAQAVRSFTWEQTARAYERLYPC
ncbi:glycosyltransferase family 4 protein [Nesterenkonia sp. NBAIMH1]|uniref:glycosyltransferase family 4 protein n=1 Tax=Nesterenkonia sp. NBAIMH1 TaxID=2600320 RepID=UPI00143D386F|nr:glycosyltransferase family 4 protein [Nesterenkonia sp. NBAIMH1]